MIDLTMPRECVITVIIEMEGVKNLGSVLTKNYMLGECAKTVILTIIIAKGARNPTKQKLKNRPVNPTTSLPHQNTLLPHQHLLLSDTLIVCYFLTN